MATHEDYLAQEYLHLQKVIEDIDTKTLTVKAWSVTFSAAAIGFAYDKKQAAILLVAAVSALAFWLVECLLKVNQQAYYARIGAIEQHFAGGAHTHAFQVGSAWEHSFNTKERYRFVFKIMWWPHIFMPHLAIATIAAGLLFGVPPRQ